MTVKGACESHRLHVLPFFFGYLFVITIYGRYSIPPVAKCIFPLIVFCFATETVEELPTISASPRAATNHAETDWNATAAPLLPLLAGEQVDDPANGLLPPPPAEDLTTQ